MKVFLWQLGMYKKINSCRICGNTNLEEVFDLGEQYFSGVFPDKDYNAMPRIPLQLVKCHGDVNICGLLQLKHSYNLSVMYGMNYGYRSGLNPTMVEHLQKKVESILSNVNLDSNDIVIDIGSNDATTLKCYPQRQYKLVGVDPTGVKFKKYYTDNILLIADFFSKERLPDFIIQNKAKVITSFSMFYDLESPLDFAKQVASVLHQEGVWVLEQSYMPCMLDRNSFDTICHEHLEYYGLLQIKWLMERAGLKIVDVSFNDINGGSFSVVVTHEYNDSYTVNHSKIDYVLEKENALGLKKSLQPYKNFASRVDDLKYKLRTTLKKIKASGKTVYALGASTKGNVTLQYFELNKTDIPFVGEVNPDKYGKITPGSGIPIISEKELLDKKPDYLLVLPWHFRDFFQQSSLFEGIKLLFPMPNVEIYCGN